MILHALDAASNGATEINVFSPDTDVFVLLLRRYYELCTEVHFVTGTGQRRRVIKLRPIAQTLGRSRLAALPGVHAVSGADVTGSFANKGKLTWWKMFKDTNEATIDALSKLGTRGLPTADTMAAIEKLVCRLYVPNTPIKTVRELRWSLFRKKQAQSEKLPPTQAAIREAIMRANCQALIWSLDSVPSPDFPPPQEYGWKLEDDQWVPIMTSSPPAPDAIIELVGCGCKTSHCSSNRCNSRKAGINCTDLCACSDNDVPCANQPEAKYESDDDDNYSGSILEESRCL